MSKELENSWAVQEIWQDKCYKLEEENKTLKDNVEFLHSCLDDRDKSIQYAKEENNKLKLHIEAKDKAYTALLKDYEELKEDNKKLKAEIEEWLNTIRQKI